jgi:hypothetical protein
MLQEIPYGQYVETNKTKEINESESNESNQLNNSFDSDLETLPVSIEVVPHKAIMIHEVYVQRTRDQNRECPNYIKWLLATSFCIPVVIVLSSVRLNN